MNDGVIKKNNTLLGWMHWLCSSEFIYWNNGLVCLYQGGRGGGKDKVWDWETMFSQLAKRSPYVVVRG